MSLGTCFDCVGLSSRVVLGELTGVDVSVGFIWARVGVDCVVLGTLT